MTASPNRYIVRRPLTTILSPQKLRDITTVRLEEHMKLRGRVRGWEEGSCCDLSFWHGAHTATNLKRSLKTRCFRASIDWNPNNVVRWVLKVDIVVATE